MKMQKLVLFITKKLKINMLKIKKHCKVRDHCYYTEEHGGDAHNICNLRNKVLKKFL